MKGRKKAKLYDENGVKFDCINYDDEEELAKKIKRKFG